MLKGAKTVRKPGGGVAVTGLFVSLLDGVAQGSTRLLLAVLVAATIGLAFADHDTACRNTPGISLAYAAHRFEAGDVNAAFDMIPPEQLAPGLDWQFFLNQNNVNQSFMYPPQWRPSIIPADSLAGDSGVRLDAPDGSAAFETFLDASSPFAARGPVALEDLASFALTQVLGNPSFDVLCVDNAISAAMAGIGTQNIFAAVATDSHYAVVKAFSLNSSGEPDLFYLVYAGPRGSFENLVRFVFAPVMDSFPKGGGGSCTCNAGEPDKDKDGTCDRCDTYPDDKNLQ